MTAVAAGSVPDRTGAPDGTLRQGRGLTQVRTLGDVTVRPGTSVLLRVDWNAPLDGVSVVDTARVDATLPTLRRLCELGAMVTVVTHLGYPGGRPDPRLSVPAVFGPRLRHRFPGVALRENLRFDAGEEANDRHFAAALAAGHDLFVNDAFACAHRPHASVVGVPALLPGVAGPLLVREVTALDAWLDPCGGTTGLAVGGAKLCDKFRLLAALAQRADVLVVGGLAALPFLIATGRSTMDGRLDPAYVTTACALLDRRPDLHLPADVWVRHCHGGFALRTGRLRAGDEYVDVGPETSVRFARALSHCDRILWNGPLGRYEQPPFGDGTARFLAHLGTALGNVTAGGGDTAAALQVLGFRSAVGRVSTGGGALLSYVTDGDLVGLAALRHSPHPLAN
jgi:phosphoglycerate kinase